MVSTTVSVEGVGGEGGGEGGEGGGEGGDGEMQQGGFA